LLDKFKAITTNKLGHLNKTMERCRTYAGYINLQLIFIYRSNSNVDLKSADNGLKKKIKKDQEKSSGKKRNVKIWTTEEDETLRK
jgi:hypothetical protein